MKFRWRYPSDAEVRLPRLIARKALTFARLRLGIPAPDVGVEFLGRRLRVRQGTIRARADEDDAWLAACQRRATCMIDVGCHMGYTAIMGLLGGTIREMVLIDASPEAVSIAAKNLIQNGLADSVRFVWAFASEHDDEMIPFFTGDAGEASSAYIDGYTHTDRGSQIQVRSVSIDGLVARYGITPDLIKIDVEGAEDSVLRGARHVAAMHTTRFHVEVHHLAKKPISETTRSILSWCEETNYSAWMLRTHTRLAHLDQIAGLGRFHLMLQPSEWVYPLWLSGIEAYKGLVPSMGEA